MAEVVGVADAVVAARVIAVVVAAEGAASSRKRVRAFPPRFRAAS